MNSVRPRELAKGEPYSEIAYKLRANIKEWLKEAKAFLEHNQVVQCFCPEQFHRRLPESVRHWVQERLDVKAVDRVGQLAD